MLEHERIVMQLAVVDVFDQIERRVGHLALDVVEHRPARAALLVLARRARVEEGAKIRYVEVEERLVRGEREAGGHL